MGTKTAGKTAATGGYLLLAGLTVLNVLNFGDRYLITAFANQIITDLGMTKFQYTLLTGFVFSIFYVLFGLFTGSLVDRHHRPRLVAAGLALWSALTAATGIARNFIEVGLARMFIGVGESVLTPASLSMLTDRLPQRRHGIAGAVYYMGIPIGVGSSFYFASVLGPMFGWRGTFVLLGAIGIVASLLVLLLRDPPRGAHHASGEMIPLDSFRDSARALSSAMRTTPVLTLVLVGTACAIFVQGATVLDVVWWVHERGYENIRAQKLIGALFLWGGVTGALIGGIGADAAYRRGKGGRLKFLALAYVVVAPIGLVYRLATPDTPAFYVAAFIGAASFMLPYGTTYATVQEVVPVNLRGAAIALLNLFATLIGHATGAALCGFLADRFTAGGIEQPVTWAMLACGIPGLFAIPCFWRASTLHARPKQAIA